MSGFFHEAFIRPIFNLLIWLYNVIPGDDLGIAIIVLTIIIKIILFPLSQKSIRSQKALQTLQPKIETLKKKFNGQREKLAQEMMKLYKEQKVNPLSSCLPLLIQLPFLFAVFRVFGTSLNGDSGILLYSFIMQPGELQTTFLGVLDLVETAPILGILAGAAQFWQTKQLMHTRAEAQTPEVKKTAKDEDMMAMVNKQMMYMLPIVTVVFGFTFPGGLMLYWLVTTLLTIAQQKFVFAEKDKKNPDPPAQKEQHATPA
jgi:YidC/Oxa1 family membrane protein insertase